MHRHYSNAISKAIRVCGGFFTTRVCAIYFGLAVTAPASLLMHTFRHFCLPLPGVQPGAFLDGCSTIEHKTRDTFSSQHQEF